ncbi:hypothetical protein [Candidatus Pelagibacter sp.]|uniref:hypothetical protein n=1 Tax=Candidatus Pelagibacter sp. TaxID=2024849 RepID=UPI003F8389E7
MKKIILILFSYLIFGGNVFAEIYELNRCIGMEEGQVRYVNAKWSEEFYKRQNVIYYEYLKEPRKIVGSEGYQIVWAQFGYEFFDDEDVNEFEKEGTKKIKWRETYSYTIDIKNNLVTELVVYTDEFLDFRREILFKKTQFYKEKGIYNGKLKQGISDDRDLWSKKIKIKEFRIEKIIGNLLIAHSADDYKYDPDDRHAIMINLDDLTVAYDYVKNLNNQYRRFFALCGNKYESVKNEENQTQKNQGSSALKSILKMLN